MTKPPTFNGREIMLRTLIGVAVAVLFAAAAPIAAVQAAPYDITLGIQQTGTAQWELTAMQNLGIDKKHNLRLTIRPLASDQAGQVALQTGDVDIILSDFVWVSLQRQQGNSVTMVPHSLAVGGLMVDPKGSVKTITDLKGKTIAASGTPVDKSWVILQAYYNKLTGGALQRDASVRFGAPPLVSQLLTSGRADATLNYWSWNAKSKVAGATVLLTVPQMLAGLGVESTPPLLGWAFMDKTAKAKPEAIKAFLDASFETKQVLLTDDKVWNGLRDAMNVKGSDALFTALRDGYRDGIVQRYNPTKMEAAAQTFALLVKYGGKDVVGGATALSDGTFYRGYSK
jgi:NitT/TauT family transport system substrate-binding protein